MLGVVNIILTAILVGDVQALVLFDRQHGHDKEIVVPELVTSFNSHWSYRRHRRSVATVPDHVAVRIKFKGQVLDLWVTRSEDNTLNVPEYHMTEDEKIEEVLDNTPHALKEVYSNRTTNTVLILEHSDSVTGGIKVSGTFQHGTKLYHIQPDTATFLDENFHHTVWEHGEVAKGDNEQCGTKPTNRYKRATPVIENTIELFLTVDESDFKRYKDLFNVNSRETKEALKLAIAYSVEAANLRLQSIRDQFSDTAVRLTCVGVLIITIPRFCDFTQMNVHNGKLNETQAASDFATFVKRNSWHLPNADHFVAFTSFPFTQNEELYVQEAKRGSMCTSESVSVVRDALSGINGQSIAHGVGHSLNAKNDDEYEDASCSNGYTMAVMQTAIDILDPVKNKNKYLFSKCSAQSIRSFMSGLTCTKRDDVFGTKLDVGNETNTELLNPDLLCLNQLGRASSFCRIFYELDFFSGGCYDAMCTQGIFCQLPFSDLCRSYTPYERTSCGNKKWCVKSQCVQDQNAPATAGDDAPAYNSLTFPCDRRLCSVYGDRSDCPLTCSGIFTCPE